MKRSPMPDRRTPLARKAPPKARKRWPDPSKPRRPVKRQSDKRVAEKPLRDAVREETLRRAGFRCEMADLVPDVKCWHPGGPRGLDVHEKAARGTNPGGHLDVDNTIAVCRAHHDWIDAHIPEAEALGVRIRSSR